MADTDNTKIPNPGLLDPVDEDDIISPGEIVGGDSILLFSSYAVWDDVAEVPPASPDEEYLVGLVQGLSINSSRMIRSVHQIGETDPVLISSVGQKSLNIANIISEATNLAKALYGAMMDNRDALYAADLISLRQRDTLAKYVDLEIPEGLPRDLMRIPFGLKLVFNSGEGDELQTVHLGHCLLATDSNAVEAGTRGIGGANAVMWQKTTYINDTDEDES